MNKNNTRYINNLNNKFSLNKIIKSFPNNKFSLNKINNRYINSNSNNINNNHRIILNCLFLNLRLIKIIVNLLIKK